MKEISSLYKEFNNSILGNQTNWLSELRANLIDNISKNGFPSKKDEIWKYSNLNHINDIDFNYFNSKSLGEIEKIHPRNEENLINIVNNEYIISDTLKKNKNIIIKNLEESIQDLRNYFFFNDKFFQNDFTIDLNTIFLNSGLCISTSNGADIKIVINYDNINSNTTNYLRNIIKVSKNSKLILIENFNNSHSEDNSSNVFNNFWLEEGAEVEHIIIQDLKPSSRILYSSLVFCYEKSKFNQLSFQVGGNSTKYQHTGNLMGEDSCINYNGIYFGKEKQFLDNKTKVIHHKENCESNQIYKGVLTDESLGVYLSNTLVNPEAQKTKGYQLSRGILLSDKCRLNNKPELKIYADDVKCSHGSTIGALDKDQLFYLQSRGLSKAQSENLLIKAFYKDVMKIVSDENSIIKIEKTIDKWLKDKNE